MKHINKQFLVPILAVCVSIVALCVSVLACVLTYRAGEISEAGQEVLVLPENRIGGTVEVNDGGKTITLLVDQAGNPGFSRAVVTVTENTALYTMDGTKIAVYPETLIGYIEVEFSGVASLKGGTLYVDATAIYK